MNVVETAVEGLKRSYKVTVPVADLAARLDRELESMKAKVTLPGFRPGRVPTPHLKRLYGRQVMADVVQNAVHEANRRIVEEGGFRLAGEPAIAFPEDQAAVAAVMEAKADLEYDVSVEVLPAIPLVNHGDIALVREVASVPADDVEQAILRMAEPQRPFTPAPEDAVAGPGDRVTVNFIGRIGGETFEGGTGQGIEVTLGSGNFIPGFEEQLLGARAGEARSVTVTFPANYQVPRLAGQEAVFDVTVVAVARPGPITIDDALAKQFGLDDLDKLREAVRATLQNELDQVSRRKLKRKLLDALDERYRFDLPPSLLEQEFSAIWSNITQEMQAAGRSFADEGTTEEAAREDYRRIAGRRVRLGLVLAEIGAKAGITVTDEEISQGVVARARQFPGQERQVVEYYRKNPEALSEIRAPLFEEKVVDAVLAEASVADRPVTKDELLHEQDDVAESTAKA